MKKKKRFLGIVPFLAMIINVSISLFLSAANTLPLPGTFQHRIWNNDNGLPMNTVMALTQTPEGYLWVGTEAGLARFDGVKFDVFSSENTPAFTSNMIYNLMVDRKNTLWIITQMGGLIQYKNKTFTAFNQYTGILSNEVWAVLESMDGSVWIASKTGLFRLDKGELTEIPLPELERPGVRTLLEDDNGRIWVGTIGDGLVLVKKKGENFECEHIGLRGIEISTLLEDRKGVIWVGTWQHGLYRFWRDQSLAFTEKNGLLNHTVRSLYEDRFGNLWIGTNGGGINILPLENSDNPQKNSIVDFPKPEAFTCNVFLGFYEDVEGTLWIGTNGGGLYSLREAKIITYTTKNGLSYNNVYGVFQDSSGRVWTGTKGYGVNYLDPEEKVFHTLTTKDGLSSDYVVCFNEDRENAVWFGTLGSGLNRLKHGKVDVFNQKNGLDDDTFRSIYTDRGGNLWAGTVKGGIFRFENNRFSKKADVNIRVNSLLKDTRGILWACTLGSGLFRIDLTWGTTDVFNEEKGLSSNIVACIHEDELEKGVFWIGTLKGLNRFQNSSFDALYKKNGLPDETAYWILEDHKHDFWVSSNQGIYCLSRKEAESFFKGEIQQVRPTVYGKEVGMRSVECNGGNQPSGWKTRDGKLWFPTTWGLSVIDPINIGMNKIPPPVIIEKIVCSGENVPVAGSINIPPGKNNLEIQYTALSFIVPEKIRFKYKLEGLDKNWHEAGGTRTVAYLNVPSGHYRFKVMACNSDGVWNKTGAEVELYLPSRFFQEPVFIIIVLSVLTFFALFLYFYNKRSHQHPDKLKHKPRTSPLPQEKTNEYIQKLLYLLDVEKLYQDPNLTLKDLAAKMLISARNLSIIINDQLNTNFYEFINEKRIKEAQRILSNPETKKKQILDVAYDVGYNSKSAFNRAFKTFTGMTPSEYRKKTNY